MRSGNPHDPPRSNCLCWTESLALETPDTDIFMYGVSFSLFNLKYPHRTFFFAIPAPVTEDPIDVHLHLYGGGWDGKHIGISPLTGSMMVYKNPPREEYSVSSLRQISVRRNIGTAVRNHQHSSLAGAD
jgi:hypothetical protein